MIFGELLTSSNYNKDIERTTGGKNGYGAKLVNIFSTKFIIEINNFTRKNHFTQEWLNNMTIINEPIITKSKDKSSVKIIFYPDFERFKINNFTEDYLKLFHRRTIDIAGTTDSKIKITFNNNKIEINNFKNYIGLYYNLPLFFDNSENNRWSVGVMYKPDSNNEVISFVNGINTYRGGTHCNYIIDTITKTLINDYIKKKDKDLKITVSSLKDNLIFFINSIIINPAFSSQTKDTLTTKIDKSSKALDYITQISIDINDIIEIVLANYYFKGLSFEGTAYGKFLYNNSLKIVAPLQHKDTDISTLSFKKADVLNFSTTVFYDTEGTKIKEKYNNKLGFYYLEEFKNRIFLIINNENEKKFDQILENYISKIFTIFDKFCFDDQEIKIPKEFKFYDYQMNESYTNKYIVFDNLYDQIIFLKK
jgi:hypothetical protein